MTGMGSPATPSHSLVAVTSKRSADRVTSCIDETPRSSPAATSWASVPYCGFVIR
jgi:hypothetical protein